MKSKLLTLLFITALTFTITSCAEEEINPIEADSNKGEVGHLEDGF